MSPVRLALKEEHSRHGCAAATRRRPSRLLGTRRHKQTWINTSWSPTGTLYPKARGLSPQLIESKLPVCALRSRDSPAPKEWSCGQAKDWLLEWSIVDCTVRWQCERFLRGGMGRMSPVRLAPCGGHSRHGCAVASGPGSCTAAPREASPTSGMTWTSRSPTGTFCPMARGLSPQLLESKLPVCALRSRASPAPKDWHCG